MSLSPGTRLGSYQILAPLGAGGMGEVYRATDTRLGRDVAIKVLPEGVSTDAGRLARFEQEARTVASLNHPNIVTLFSVEDADGIRFLTMELVEGQGLDRHVVPGGLAVARVVELGIALTDALSAAHDKGVVHRDLKPANVMLTAGGSVKVLDFGLAKLEATPSDIDTTLAATIASPLSGAGEVLGTIPYMAPEQVRGEAVDNRTDIFALGILLYELATGRRPFEGATLGMISTAILRDAPPTLSGIRPDAPDELERVIGRCLEKDPARRFQTALEVRDELRTVGQAREAAPPLKPPPAPSTPLLGREELLATAAQQVLAGARVLTITGYGGTGKTRFAMALFDRLAAGFPGGAAFVSLASVTVGSEVLATVALALDVAEAQGRSALDALVTVVAERRMLLVLDNLEQVLDCAEDLAALVSRCRGLQVVATSRAPLKIGAESEFVLPPLELPGSETTSLDALRQCPSVALLVQRAEKVKPGFTLNADNAAALSAICRRLDGLPLALELAAARVRILEPAALLQRLDHALDLLTSGDRDLPLRQRTLRATISWSYSLLEANEQQLLRRASVFHEGWTLESMERVCYGDDDRFGALDELESLVEKGLVRVVGSGERYSLLETIRAFSAEQLHAGGEVEEVRNAHADYYLELAADVAAGMHRNRQLEVMDRARADNANLLAAVHWWVSGAKGGDANSLEKALLLCGYLNWYWHICGQHFTGRAFLDVLFPLAADALPSRGRARAFLTAGMISTTTGEWSRSRDEWGQGHTDGVAVGDEEAAAEGMMGVGYCNISLGNPPEAIAALDEAIARSIRIGFEFMQGISMSLKGTLLFISGDLESGKRLIEQSVAIYRRLDHYEGRGVGQSLLAQVAFAEGNHDRALGLYRDSLQDLETVGDHPEIARVRCEMGWTALAAADARAAREYFRLAVQRYEEVGSPRGTGLALMGLAAAVAAEGRSELALTIAYSAQALSERAGIVIAHPMDPGVAGRIEELKASIPKRSLDGLVANASALSPAAILATL